MYVGRIVAIGRTAEGRACAMYRVSSRSFPNRRAVVTETGVAIVPKPGYEQDVARNPYIAYNCLRIVGETAVATNGSHTDPIAEKIASGMSVRDALVFGLTVLDYEKDKYNTPRIAAVIRAGAEEGWLGIVRHDALLVQRFALRPGKAFYVATYEHNAPDPDYCDTDFNPGTAADACDYILGQGVFADLERPITAAAALQDAAGNAFEIAVRDAPATAAGK